jgi:3-hydroxyisobutyrate dehydrogenase-like beta-hydroxyacid dehydrogenase
MLVSSRPHYVIALEAKFEKGNISSMSENVGFIGLGSMGSPMALNVLKAGYKLTVYNRNASKAEPLTNAGAKLAQRPADVATPGNIVITMVANDEALESVTLGPDGILERLGPNGIHISMSTVSPEISSRLAELHALHKSTYIAAPVFGRPEAAAAQKLWIAIAGDKEAKARIRPLLDAMGQGVYDFGEEPAKANIVKVSGNFMIASAIETMSEMLNLAEKNGIDREQIMKLFNTTLFAAPIYQNYGNNIAARNFDTVGFQMQLALKDIDLVLAASKKAQSPMPFASHLHDRLLTGIARGRGDRDWMEMATGVAEDSGLK